MVAVAGCWCQRASGSADFVTIWSLGDVASLFCNVLNMNDGRSPPIASCTVHAQASISCITAAAADYVKTLLRGAGAQDRGIRSLPDRNIFQISEPRLHCVESLYSPGSWPCPLRWGFGRALEQCAAMGKHNGKARTSGAKVGSALVNKAKKVPSAFSWFACPAPISSIPSYSRGIDAF